MCHISRLKQSSSSQYHYHYRGVALIDQGEAPREGIFGERGPMVGGFAVAQLHFRAVGMSHATRQEEHQTHGQHRVL